MYVLPLENHRLPSDTDREDYNRFSSMAKCCRKFDLLADISPSKEFVRIRVRVIRLWKAPGYLNPFEVNSIEMVLVDESGGKIHASIRKQFLFMFDSKIVEGEVYQMSYFAVVPQVGYYRTTLHPYKLIFQIKTKIVPDQNCDISPHGLSFTSLAEIRSHVVDYEFLVDVMGVVTGISAERELVRDGKKTKMVVVELTDSSGKCDCTLFGDYAAELNKKVGKSGGGLPVIVIQFAKVKIFRDQVSLQNVVMTTKIYVNPDMPEAKQFKDSIAVHGIELDAIVPTISAPGKPVMEDEFLKMYPKKKIAELLGMEEEGKFVVSAVIRAVVPGGDWWYPACRCRNSIIPDSGAYFCKGCCKHVFQIVPRFKVKVEVCDGEGACVFVIFDADMTYLMEKTCAEFVGKAKVPNDGSYPDEFEGLVGQKMLFIVEKNLKMNMSSFVNFKVRRVCMESKIVEEFCSQGPYSTPVKSVSAVVDADGADGSVLPTVVEDSAPIISIMDDVVASPVKDKHIETDSDCVVTGCVKRNLGKLFDEVAKEDKKKRLRKVKIEKD